MIPVPSGVRVWLAVGRTDMRKGMNGLALQVQEVLGRDPHVGDLYVFRGARGGLIKLLWHDGIGLWLYNYLTSYCSSLFGTEDFDSVVWPTAVRSTSGSHRLLCLTGGFGPGASYK